MSERHIKENPNNNTININENRFSLAKNYQTFRMLFNIALLAHLHYIHIGKGRREKKKTQERNEHRENRVILNTQTI